MEDMNIVHRNVDAEMIEALLKLSAKTDPVLAEVWDKDKDSAYDRV